MSEVVGWWFLQGYARVCKSNNQVNHHCLEAISERHDFTWVFSRRGLQIMLNFGIYNPNNNQQLQFLVGF